MLTPEDYLAELVKDYLGSQSYSDLAPKEVVRSHLPIVTPGELCDILTNVFPNSVNDQNAARTNNDGSPHLIDRTIEVAVQVLTPVGRNDVAGQDRAAFLARETDLFVRKAFGGYSWTGSNKERFRSEWLNHGIYTSTIVATYRRSGILAQ